MYFVLYNPRGSLQSSTLENVRGRRRGAERVNGRDEFGQRERRTGERTENEAEKGKRERRDREERERKSNRGGGCTWSATDLS